MNYLNTKKASEFACKAQKRNKTLEVTQRWLFEYILCIYKNVFDEFLGTT